MAFDPPPPEKSLWAGNLGLSFPSLAKSAPQSCFRPRPNAATRISRAGALVMKNLCGFSESHCSSRGVWSVIRGYPKFTRYVLPPPSAELPKWSWSWLGTALIESLCSVLPRVSHDQLGRSMKRALPWSST